MLVNQASSHVIKQQVSVLFRASSHVRCTTSLNKINKREASILFGQNESHQSRYLNKLMKCRPMSFHQSRGASETNIELNSNLYEMDQELFDLDLVEEDSSLATEANKAINSIKNDFHLLNYVQACVTAGFWKEGIDAVMVRDSLSQHDAQSVEYLLQSLVCLPKSESDHLDVPQSIIGLFRKLLLSNITPSPNACACVLAAMYKYNAGDELIASILRKVEEVHTMEECLKSCHLHGEARIFLRSLLDQHRPGCVSCVDEKRRKILPITSQIYGASPPSNSSIHHHDWTSSNHVTRLFKQQLAMETQGYVSLPNVLSNRKKGKQNSYGRTLDNLHKEWSIAALKSFRSLKGHKLKKWRLRLRYLSVYPFLSLIPDREYIDIIINHICQLPKSGEPTLNTVHSLGSKVFSRYALKQYLTDESTARLQDLYHRYLSLYMNKNSKSIPREHWEELEKEFGSMRGEGQIQPWQNYWKILVGKQLLEIMVSSFTVDIGGEDQVPSAYLKDIPAVYNSYKPWGDKICGMTVPHPIYYNLVKSAKNDIKFDADLLPMIVPPLPWINEHQGGFLCRPSELVRRSYSSPGSSRQLIPVFDALNVQGSVAWSVNQRLLNIQLKIFRSTGDPELKIAPAPIEVPQEMRYIRGCAPEKRKELVSAYHRMKKISNEMNSLHADALYKFSIANYFRDKMIWLPHNLDFRGRSYPIPPHFNYMGDDVSRSLFMFADGKPLGKRGLRWLKIHLVNLTGLKKNQGLQERLDFAEEIIDDVIDSAEHPLDGRGWWKKSEEPWQTLAACMELTDALKTSDPENFISHLPIHQDGSCNGLQHYAALGRDEIGAKQVNLDPSSTPQDVYIGVAEIVEELRRKDAEQGVSIAKDLEGFITRKVVKQTVMTTVYGVTRFGGALQVRKKLALDHFPSEKRLQASVYIVNNIFNSISSMFSSAVHIQKWFTDIASCISKGGRTVEWVNVLGLLSVQPYFKQTLSYTESSIQPRIYYNSPTSVPNVMKQCNAFPPNFVHSLDSMHMMLTALHCFHSGVKFSAIHDCYWSHASTVDQMNKICRQQFVALHEEPILESFAAHLKRFLPEGGHGDRDSWIASSQQKRLRELLSSIPQKGNFNLNRVKESTFFFS